ncbi:MAG TPA: M56 family metallopeptidase [Marmoricola sp.]|jgi:Zn-dependent protease with chaperone function|nr:M56 family metallopeptidase [Marmoricola sp.]
MFGWAVTLLGYAAATMMLAPVVLAGRTWSYRYPRAALVGWLVSLGTGVAALVASLGLLIARTLSVAAAPTRTGEARDSTVVANVAIFVLSWVLCAAVGGLISLALYRAVPLLRSNHRVRRSLAEHYLQHGALCLVAGTPVVIAPGTSSVAMTIPGNGGLIVVSSELIAALTAPELGAIVAHEDAHRRHGHFLLMELACVHRLCVPAFPSARAFERSIAVLIELAADDHAARRCGRRTTAAALSRVGRLREDESFTLRAARLV